MKTSPSIDSQLPTCLQGQGTRVSALLPQFFSKDHILPLWSGLCNPSTTEPAPFFPGFWDVSPTDTCMDMENSLFLSPFVLAALQ